MDFFRNISARARKGRSLGGGKYIQMCIQGQPFQKSLPLALHPLTAPQLRPHYPPHAGH